MELDRKADITRRRLLLGLASLVPIGLLMPLAVNAAGEDDSFLDVSRVITGDSTLSAGIAQRVKMLLGTRVSGFASQLGDLVEAFHRTGGSRDQMLAALSDSQVQFALAIARPWYLGYVGKPSDFVLKDDAAFATYLEAQSWSKIVHEVPRPTYPGANAGWWGAAPPGVVAPAMPEGITRWTFHPGGPAQILTPDSTWKAYATADHTSIDAARLAKPGTT
ncbi:MAG: sorbitol dehydrogenase family protein [Pseudomonadota bacterium]|nr:sorbitol dehydrogenase family protein [Pseudomonadota bacterium]